MLSRMKAVPPPPLFRTIAYGPSPNQVGDLYLPSAGRAPAAVICLLHGGFWRLPWARDHLAPIAIDLAGRGYAVWNLEYRRVGEEGGGWPGTMQDVDAGINHLAALPRSGEAIGLDRVTVVGHSAGGHLALWAARRARQSREVEVTAAVGLAAVADLRMAYGLGCGRGAVTTFLGGAPDEYDERYRAASPADLLPLGVAQLLIHGTEDEDVAVEISRSYAQAARAAGDEVTFIELAGASHMEFVDPASEAHATLCRWLSHNLAR
jgi:acetyl esterase/lipase